MTTHDLGKRGLAPLAAILILAATRAIADAHFAAPDTDAAMRPGIPMTLAQNVGHPPYNGPRVAPPVPATDPQRPPAWSNQTGSGQTGGFTPGGGSGTKPIKKPNLK
jgi:hypothetical protein